MGDKIEKLSDEELTGILKYEDPNFKFFREIAAKWAKQYADHQDGPAIACWAKEKAGLLNYVALEFSFCIWVDRSEDDSRERRLRVAQKKGQRRIARSVSPENAPLGG